MARRDASLILNYDMLNRLWQRLTDLLNGINVHVTFKFIKIRL